MDQGYLPIYALESKRILGVLNLGGNETFVGNETTFELPSGLSVAIQRIVPQQSNIRPVNPEFMAAVFNHEQVRTEAYRGFPEFVPLSDTQFSNIAPSSWWSAASGTGPILHHTNGLVIDGLEKSFEV